MDGDITINGLRQFSQIIKMRYFRKPLGPKQFASFFYVYILTLNFNLTKKQNVF